MDEARRKLVEQVITDAGGAFTVGLGYIGDRLGLFRELARGGPLSSGGLAGALDLDERYVRELLKAMVSAGYVEVDADGLFFMTPDQQSVLADEASPVFAAGAFQFAVPSLALTEQLIACFCEGGGIAYSRLGPEIPDAIDRMHRAWFEHHLTASWLPAVPALDERLREGARVLDVGCGLGRASVALARAYQASRILGIELHAPSIEEAQARNEEAGLENVRFRVAGIEAMPASGERFDLVLAIDCIHDMADPV